MTLEPIEAAEGVAVELVGPTHRPVFHVITAGGTRVLSMTEDEARALVQSGRVAIAILDEARGVHDVPVPFTDPEAYRAHRATCGLCRRLGDW